MNENDNTANNEYREIWLRLGISLKITEDEEKAILGTDKEASLRTLSDIVANRRMSVNGNTYIPETCVYDFNKRYGTNYAVNDVDMNIDELQLPSAPKISDDDLKELRGQLVDIVEDYMTEKCVPDKDAVFIKGDDYDKLADKFIGTLKNWSLI